MTFPSSRLFLIICCCFVVKILLASFLPLVNDEAYTIAVSQEMSLSFFDHPPIGFWSALIFSELFGLQNSLIFRLPYLLFSLGTTFIIFQLGKELGGRSVGLWSALIYNTAPFYFFSGGFLIVPDGPLNLGITLSALCIIKLHKNQPEKCNHVLIILGTSLAWSFACKYQGFLFGVGCFLTLLISSKRSAFIRNPYLYLCLLIALLGLIPTLLWNYHYNWVSFQFHGERQGASINILNFSQMFIGALIYLLPPIVLIPISQLISKIRKDTNLIQNKSFEMLLVLMALPNIIIFSFVFISSDKTFPHWIMPGWLLLIPIIAKILDDPLHRLNRLFFSGSFFIIWPLLGVLIIHTQTGILTNHIKKIPPWDNTLELINWQPLRKPLLNLINNYAQNSEAKLAAFTWIEAGQLSTMMKNEFETLVIEGEPHHFAFLDKSVNVSPTFMVKLSIGNNPDISSILKRIKKYDLNAIHLENVPLLRGVKNYATASIYLLNQ